jgi:hypothetical protein
MFLGQPVSKLQTRDPKKASRNGSESVHRVSVSLGGLPSCPKVHHKREAALKVGL